MHYLSLVHRLGRSVAHLLALAALSLILTITATPARAQIVHPVIPPAHTMQDLQVQLQTEVLTWGENLSMDDFENQIQLVGSHMIPGAVSYGITYRPSTGPVTFLIPAESLGAEVSFDVSFPDGSGYATSGGTGSKVEVDHKIVFYFTVVMQDGK